MSRYLRVAMTNNPLLSEVWTNFLFVESLRVPEKAEGVEDGTSSNHNETIGVAGN